MTRTRIGIDVGALTVKAVRLDASSSGTRSAYRFHHGDPAGTLHALLVEIGAGDACDVAATRAAAALLPACDSLHLVDDVHATIAAVTASLPEARNIIDIGAVGLRFIRLDAAGRFAHYSANSQCAAGTGSFLDEQATRLGLTYERLATLAPVLDPPPVATRCAVFAKSDLIHLQQTGATIEQMWSGLCRGMAQTALQTLLRGRRLRAPTALVGGVVRHHEVRRWLATLADAPLLVGDDAHVAAALGAALLLQQSGNGRAPVDWRAWLAADARSAAQPAARLARSICPAPPTPAPGRVSRLSSRAPLLLRRTRYPSFEVEASGVDAFDNEVRVSRWPAGGSLAGFLGIDVGSTSTKLCLVDPDGEVLVDVYRKTAGDPIGATQRLFDGLAGLAAARRTRLEIAGCGTTGSGRKLVGAIVGADAVVNEISAHVAGAMHVDPSLDTLFEIGGQDSKYVRTRGGIIVDSNMNYVCAAGTGSFVEEQARKLGVPLAAVGDRVLGLVPPPSSDRCTVFMEQDVVDLLRAGYDVDHALAAVMRSVVQNYLNKVVGHRPWSTTRIGFQGATARNKGLVAAFETLLGVEMVVSPYCHVMGAWGVALLARDEIRRQARPCGFLGLQLSRRRIELRQERCELCNNNCAITFADIEGVDREPSWGYLCGRDPQDARLRVHAEYDVFRRRRSWLLRTGARASETAVPGRAPRVVIPRALTFHSHLPFWRRLLLELGARVELAPESTRTTRERGAALVGAEFCFPVKLAHGQVGEALETGGDFVLVPRMVAQPPAGRQTDTWFCPYVQGFPAAMEAALANAGAAPGRLLAPTLDRRRTETEQVEELYRTLGPALAVDIEAVRRAWRQAGVAQAEFETRCLAEGRAALERLEREDRRGLVIVGRPYNLGDPAANLDLPRKIAEMGFVVIPADVLPFDPADLPERYRNVYWAYGQRILAVLQQVRHNDRLSALYFTNFNCGPDSFLLSYANEIMGDKPMLALELDEQSADAGYITRIEAFLDVLRHSMPAGAAGTAPAPPPRPRIDDDVRRRRLWIPPMHPVSSELFAAAFRGAGYDAAALASESRADLERGQRSTRGCECLPLRTTVGCFLNTIESSAERDREHALFMPTARGPCRFGQYAILDRLVLERLGRSTTPILSPSSDNAYGGLPPELQRTLWKALLAADQLEKLACRIRPYEATAGDADGALQRWQRAAAAALEDGRDLPDVVRRAGREFQRLPVRPEHRPLVGVVGEIYVRNNVFANEDLVRCIERAGGEVWASPIPEWILFTTWYEAWEARGRPPSPRAAMARAVRRLRFRLMQRNERAFRVAAGPVLEDRHEPALVETVRAGQRWIPFNVGGETLLSLGRAAGFVRDGAALVVNASPFGCLAGTLAASLFARFEADTGVPVLNLFYEGAGGVNRPIDVFVANLAGRGVQSGPPHCNPVHRAQRVAASSARTTYSEVAATAS